MAGISGTLTNTLVSKLTSTSQGVNIRIGAITQGDATLAPVSVKSVLAQNVSVDISDNTGHTHYPSILVYCDKLSNAMTEKFREFSGHARMNAEVRHSEDRLDRVQTNLQTAVDAVCALLADSRGDWGNGAFYVGGYDVTYEPVVRGGKNFLQRAKVSFELEVSR
jgi:hypothetical protein